MKHMKKLTRNKDFILLYASGSSTPDHYLMDLHSLRSPVQIKNYPLRDNVKPLPLKKNMVNVLLLATNHVMLVLIASLGKGDDRMPSRCT